MEVKDEEIAFLGKITAGITHEINNVLAIIKESSGLVEDILSIRQDAPIPHKEKIQTALSTIQGQIQRGVELTSRLSRFAHSPDQTTATCDLYEMVEQLVWLSQRFARLKSVALRCDPQDEKPIIATNPVQLQMALFTGIECCLNLMPAGGQIHVRAKKTGEKRAVHILCKGNFPNTADFAQSVSVSEGWSTLQEIVAVLKGTVQLDESTPGIWLYLPGKKET